MKEKKKTPQLQPPAQTSNCKQQIYNDIAIVKNKYIIKIKKNITYFFKTRPFED